MCPNKWHDWQSRLFLFLIHNFQGVTVCQDTHTQNPSVSFISVPKLWAFTTFCTYSIPSARTTQCNQHPHPWRDTSGDGLSIGSRSTFFKLASNAVMLCDSFLPCHSHFSSGIPISDYDILIRLQFGPSLSAMSLAKFLCHDFTKYAETIAYLAERGGSSELWFWDIRPRAFYESGTLGRLHHYSRYMWTHLWWAAVKAGAKKNFFRAAICLFY